MRSFAFTARSSDGAGSPYFAGNRSHKDLAHKSIALSRNGLDKARIGFVIFEGTANFSDRVHEVVFRHKRVFPDRIKQFLLFNGPTAIFYQVDQCLERLRSQVDSLLASIQAMTL